MIEYLNRCIDPTVLLLINRTGAIAHIAEVHDRELVESHASALSLFVVECKNAPIDLDDVTVGRAYFIHEKLNNVDIVDTIDTETYEIANNMIQHKQVDAGNSMQLIKDAYSKQISKEFNTALAKCVVHINGVVLTYSNAEHLIKHSDIISKQEASYARKCIATHAKECKDVYIMLMRNLNESTVLADIDKLNIAQEFAKVKYEYTL